MRFKNALSHGKALYVTYNGVLQGTKCHYTEQPDLYLETKYWMTE